MQNEVALEKGSLLLKVNSMLVRTQPKEDSATPVELSKIATGFLQGRLRKCGDFINERELLMLGQAVDCLHTLFAEGDLEHIDW